MSIDWLDEPTVDRYGTVTIGRYGGWLVQIAPMIYNDRLVLTPEHAPDSYDFGWCYPKGGQAHLAALAWNPDAEGEPVAYIKRAVGHHRRPGEQAIDPAHLDRPAPPPGEAVRPAPAAADPRPAAGESTTGLFAAVRGPAGPATVAGGAASSSDPRPVGDPHGRAGTARPGAGPQRREEVRVR